MTWGGTMLICLLFLGLGSYPCGAQMSITLEESMEFARENSPDIRRTRLDLERSQPQANLQDASFVEEAWEAHSENEYREHLLRALRPQFTRPLLDSIFREGTIGVPKVLLETTPELEAWMLPLVESWLDAGSYDLREAALFRLWIADPAGRSRYLDRVARNGSLEDLSLQQLWWLLAVFTEPYAEREQRMEYLERLRETTAPAYSWEIRENGIAMLNEVNALNQNNISDIVQATEHHSWQFRKFARSVFDSLLTDESQKALVMTVVRTFPREEFSYVYEKIEIQ